MFVVEWCVGDDYEMKMIWMSLLIDLMKLMSLFNNNNIIDNRNNNNRRWKKEEKEEELND